MNRTATYHRRRRHPTSPLYLLGHAVHTHPVCSLLTIGLSCSDSIKVQAHPLMTKASPLHDKLWGLGRKTGSADTIRQVVKSSSAGRDVRCVLCCVSLCVCVCVCAVFVCCADTAVGILCLLLMRRAASVCAFVACAFCRYQAWDPYPSYAVPLLRGGRGGGAASYNFTLLDPFLVDFNARVLKASSAHAHTHFRMLAHHHHRHRRPH